MLPTGVRDEARLDDPQGQHGVSEGKDARWRRDVLRWSRTKKSEKNGRS
jgi:hypothetical protein